MGATITLLAWGSFFGGITYLVVKNAIRERQARQLAQRARRKAAQDRVTREILEQAEEWRRLKKAAAFFGDLAITAQQIADLPEIEPNRTIR